jgi:hypothetical protein
MRNYISHYHLHIIPPAILLLLDIRSQYEFFMTLFHTHCQRLLIKFCVRSRLYASKKKRELGEGGEQFSDMRKRLNVSTREPEIQLIFDQLGALLYKISINNEISCRNKKKENFLSSLAFRKSLPLTSLWKYPHVSWVAFSVCIENERN